MTNDIRTPREKERELKHQRICTLYQTLRRAYPNAAPSRLFEAVAGEVGYTTFGVSQVLVRKGLYQRRK